MADSGKKYYFAVGQQSFESNGRRFSTAIPIADVDGDVVKDTVEEFPSLGRVWWMHVGDARTMQAPPGCLILSRIEEIPPASNAEHVFQLKQPIIPSKSDLIEIVEPDDAPLDPNMLLDDFHMRCNHEPTLYVFVKIGEFVYGPLRAKIESVAGDRPIEPVIRFSKPVSPSSVYKIPLATLSGRQGYFSASATVQIDRKKDSGNVHQAHYSAITGKLFSELRNEVEEIDIISLLDAISIVSQEFVSRRERREFLDRLSKYCKESEATEYCVSRVRDFLQRKDANLSAVQGLFDTLSNEDEYVTYLTKGIDKEVEKRVEQKSGLISSRAEQSAKAKLREVAILEEKKRNLSADIETQREHHLGRLNAELNEKRNQVNDELNKKRSEIDLQQKALDDSAVEAAGLIESERNRVLADFLALEPLLQRLGYQIESENPINDMNETSNVEPSPAFVKASIPGNIGELEPLSEEEFFERFKFHVEECGFMYDVDDLLAFHLSAKGQSPIILSGVSGTGKSSLPVLYEEALAGEESISRYTAIDVNPSWIAPADLMGYTDAIKHRFIPSASGMVHSLISAYDSYRASEDFANVFVVSFEEINLAQPEYYLGDILQAVSRAKGGRKINLFDSDVIRGDDPYFPYARLEVAPNLIIVGTMNDDETTRKLSKRFLDRCNMISFATHDLFLPYGREDDTGMLEATTGVKSAGGRPVLQVDRLNWTQSNVVPPLVVEVLEMIQPELNILGCGLTQRRQSAIAKFVANAPASLCSVEKAIDLQLCQRVLPQIRNVFNPRAVEALYNLIRKVQGITSYGKAIRALEHIASEESVITGGFLEEE